MNCGIGILDVRKTEAVPGDTWPCRSTPMVYQSSRALQLLSNLAVPLVGLVVDWVVVSIEPLKLNL